MTKICKTKTKLFPTGNLVFSDFRTLFVQNIEEGQGLEFKLHKMLRIKVYDK